MATDAHGITLSGTRSDTNERGFKFSTKAAVRFTKCTKHSSSTVTTAYLRESGGSLIESVTFSGDVATFNSDLSDDTIYIIACDRGGASYTGRHFSGTWSYPITSGTYIDWESSNIDESNWGYEIISVDSVVVASVTVQPSTLTLSTTQQTPTIFIPKTIAISTMTLGVSIETPNLKLVSPPSSSVELGTGDIGTRFIATRYPVEDGLNASTQRQTGHISNLVAESSIVRERETEGIR